MKRWERRIKTLQESLEKLPPFEKRTNAQTIDYYMTLARIIELQDYFAPDAETRKERRHENYKAYQKEYMRKHKKETASSANITVS